MMVIEGADRFGLAQLHQLRGRVGRGSVESFCVLVTDSTDEVAMARLRAVVESTDGFALAEKDFELRKEGDVLGLAQSGFPRLRVASLQVAEHRDLAVRARAHAERLLDGAGGLAPRSSRPRRRARRAAGSGAWPRASRRAGRDRRRRRPGHRRDGPRHPARCPGLGDPAARGPGQGDALRHPRAGPARRGRRGPVRGFRRRRHRGPVAGCGPCRLRRARSRARPR